MTTRRSLLQGVVSLAAGAAIRTARASSNKPGTLLILWATSTFWIPLLVILFIW